MKKFIFFLAFFSYSINASVIIGSPNVEINPEGLYLIKFKISSNNSIAEDKILFTNFKSDDELSDFEFEFKMALMNRNHNDKISTLFLMPHAKYTHVSSSMVREVASLKGDVSDYVPKHVNDALKEKYGN